MTNELELLGEKIKSLRVASNMTQSQLSDYLECDQTLISKVENGERTINSEMLSKISLIFCKPVNFFTFNNNQEFSCEIAFRSNSLSSEELKNISKINNIVLNQFEMDLLLEGD